MRRTHAERVAVVAKKVIEGNYRARLVDSQFEGETALAETVERCHSQFVVRIIGRLLIVEPRLMLYTELHRRRVHSSDNKIFKTLPPPFPPPRSPPPHNP